MEEDKAAADRAVEGAKERSKALETEVNEVSDSGRIIRKDLSAAEEAIRQLEIGLRDAEHRASLLHTTNHDKDEHITDIAAKVLHWQGVAEAKELAKETAEHALGDFARQSSMQLEQLAHWQRIAADLRCEVQDKESAMAVLTASHDKASKAVAATQEGALDAMRDNGRLKADLEQVAMQLERQEDAMDVAHRHDQQKLKEREREIRLLRDEMQQVEQLLQAELATRNEALATARAEAVTLKQQVSALERDQSWERERCESWEMDSYKAQVHADALSAENTSLRRNNEALAAELDALASSVNRHMTHPKSAFATMQPLRSPALIPPSLSSSTGERRGMRDAGASLGRDTTHSNGNGRTALHSTNFAAQTGVSESPWGSPVLLRGSPL